MRAAIPPLPNTSSWYGAQLSTGYFFTVWYLVKHRDNFTFTFMYLPQHEPALQEGLLLVVEGLEAVTRNNK
jgi:hypothetical protein